MIPKLANRPYFLMESVEECCRECIDGGSSVGDGGGGWGGGGGCLLHVWQQTLNSVFRLVGY